MTSDETKLLAAAYSDATLIDRAVAAGLTRSHFSDWRCSAQWALLCETRMAGGETDATAIYGAALQRGILDKLGGLPAITECSTVDYNTALNGPALLSILLARYARREAWKLLERGKEMVEGDGADLAAVGKLAEDLVSVCAGKSVSHRSVADIAEEAEAEANASIAGTIDKGPLIMTGLAKFDQYASPIRSHEYVIVAGRSSHGKSSLMLQIAGHNLALGKRVVIFSLETSDRAVVKQLAAQRAEIDLRDIGGALRERQDRYLKGLRWLSECKNLLVFDRDLSLDAIQARCRLLAQSFGPQLVIIDYLGIIQGGTGSEYERISEASGQMIGLTKSLQCTLMVGAQLNQGPEKDNRPPGRTDFRGSGQILEDCHRAIITWRKPDQQLDRTVYDHELLQVKLRDGACASITCKFNGPFTRFYD